MTSRPALCDDPAAIDADWMQRALAAGDASDCPAIGDVVVEDLGSATNAFGRLLRCHLTVDGGLAADPATVIVKLPTADRRAFRFAKWLSMHERECLYYRRLARHARIRSPALLYGDFDEDTHRFVLVLEDLRDVPGDRRRIEREALEEYHDIVRRLGARDFTFDDCWRSYRQNMLSVLLPCILACGGLDLGNRRLHDLVKSGLERALAAMEDLDVAEFLPPGRFLSAGNALSILSRGAYKAFRLAGRTAP